MSLSHSKKSPVRSIVDWFSHRWIQAAYGSAKWIYLFYPLALIFLVISHTRKYLLKKFFQGRISVPVIVVGNISLGGTGKTPLLIALVQFFQQRGKKVGVVSRGYGGKAEQYPCVLNKESQANEVGDEPLMIFNRTSAAVCVGSNRVESANKLVELGCDLILSDDGLQHYRLARDIEILVVDAVRQFGNQQLIPAGPLRESVKRASQVDFIGVNETAGSAAQFKSELIACLAVESGFNFKLTPKNFVQVSTGKSFSILEFIATHPISNQVAGIGHPDGFFSTLASLGLSGDTHSFPDHHPFVAKDLQAFENSIVVMTEKDAVKVKSFAQPNWFYLESGVELDSIFLNRLDKKLAQLKQ